MKGRASSAKPCLFSVFFGGCGRQSLPQEALPFLLLLHRAGVGLEDDLLGGSVHLKGGLDSEVALRPGGHGDIAARSGFTLRPSGEFNAVSVHFDALTRQIAEAGEAFRIRTADQHFHIFHLTAGEERIKGYVFVTEEE